MGKYIFLLLGALVASLPTQAAQQHIRIIQDNAPAIVAVNVAQKTGATFTATGFFLTSDGLIATNRHVCDNALYINITTQQGVVSGEAQLIAVAQNVDLALLKIQAQDLPTVKINAVDPVLPGQDITVIGNPRRLQNTISSGLISQVRQKSDGTIWYQISAPISPSSSGSPVFNSAGEVIAIAFASLPGENNQNLNFAVPIDYLLQLARAVGYQLPAKGVISSSTAFSTNPFIRHVQKSWAILRRLLGFSSQKA